MFNGFAMLVLALWLPAAVQPPADRPAKSSEKPAQPAPKSEKLDSKAAETAKQATKAQESGLPATFGVSSEAEKLLDDAISKVEDLKQYRADVRQIVEILGHRFVSDGRCAFAPDFRMLFELKVQLTDTSGTLVEVCDGHTHWRSQMILDTHEVARLDLDEVRPIFEKPQFSKQIRDDLIKFLGFGGIVPLLRGLRDSQKFDGHSEQMLDDVAVYVLEGRPKYTQPERRGEEGTGKASARPAPATPPYLPDKTTLWIGREDGWPYRLKLEASQKVQGTATTITLEFLNAQIGGELSDDLFHFAPPEGVEVTNRTQFMKDLLNRALAQQTQETSAKAKSSGDSSTGQPRTEASKEPSKATSARPAPDPSAKRPQ